MTNEKIDACTTIADLQKLVPNVEQLVSAAKFGLKSQLRGKQDREALKQLKAAIAAGKVKIGADGAISATK